MIRKSIIITKEQNDFLKNRKVKLSKLVQNTIEVLMRKVNKP